MIRHRIVLTGGGTGGHIYPALSVAEHLQVDGEVEAILYVGVQGRLEEKRAKEKGIEFVGLKASGLPRRLSGKLLTWPFEMTRAVLEAKRVLKLFRPTAVLGTGGYASAAPLAAAKLMSVPYAIHESDSFPGLANRLFSRWASLVSVGSDAAPHRLKAARAKIVVNGNPVRKSFLDPLGRDAACAVLGLDKSLRTVIVTGGSQGAMAINEAMTIALPSLLELDPPVQILHQVGERNIDEYRHKLDRSVLDNSRYILRDYFSDLSLPYAACDLAVCRSGAITIAELQAAGVPALFIPFPAAAADHQRHNAEFMQRREAAIVLHQEELTGRSLRESITGLLSDSSKLSAMSKAMRSMSRPHAALDLADQVKELSSAFQARRQIREKQLS